MTAKQNTTPEAPTHIYACTAYGWAVGKTREQCIKRLAADVGAETIKRMVKSVGGMYVWTCLVLAPISAEYRIIHFEPQGVRWRNSLAFYITGVRGAHTLVEPTHCTTAED